MAQFRARRLVSVPAGIAYAVAASVAEYRLFLPLLEQTRIIGPVRDDNGMQSFRAELAIGYGKLGIREKFTSDVTCDAARRTVTAVSREAPFRSMKTVWTIADAAGRAEVSIEIEYTMRNPLLQVVLAGVMDMAVRKVMAAFEERALDVYAAARNN